MSGLGASDRGAEPLKPALRCAAKFASRPVNQQRRQCRPNRTHDQPVGQRSGIAK